jgi:hypothetical protein
MELKHEFCNNQFTVDELNTIETRLIVAMKCLELKRNFI